MACALIVGAGDPTAAEPSNDSELAEVNEALATAGADVEGLTERANQAVEELASANEALPGAKTALAQAKGRVAGARSAARRAQREADAAKAEAEAARAAFAEAVSTVERSRDEIAEFVDATYRGRNVAMFNALFETQSPGDFVDSIAYLQRSADSRRRALADFVAARLAARVRADAADQASSRADQALSVAQGELDAAMRAEQEAAEAAANVQEVIDRGHAAMETVRSERDAVIARYEQLQSQSRALTERIREAGDDQEEEAEGGNDPPASSSGGLSWPVRGYLTSGFGKRFHPVFHIWRMHTGIDIAAGYGAPIRACASGVVIEAGWHGGYGNFTCVYHGKQRGKRVTTCYAHQSATHVFTGEHVSQGEVIGEVGSTGVSTGNHLHFEVRVSGEPVDPMGWL